MRVRIKDVPIGSTGALSGFLLSMKHTKTYPRNGKPLHLYDVTIGIEDDTRMTIHIEGVPEGTIELMPTLMESTPETGRQGRDFPGRENTKGRAKNPPEGSSGASDATMNSLNRLE